MTSTVDKAIPPGYYPQSSFIYVTYMNSHAIYVDAVHRPHLCRCWDAMSHSADGAWARTAG